MFGYLILVVIAAALAPTLFSSVNSSNLSQAPAWVVTVAPIVVGAFFLGTIYIKNNLLK